MLWLHTREHMGNQRTLILCTSDNDECSQSFDQQINHLGVHLPWIGAGGHAAAGVDNDERVMFVKPMNRQKFCYSDYCLVGNLEYQVALVGGYADSAYEVESTFDFVHYVFRMLVSCGEQGA